ncbi:MAG: PLP-dependent transferase [Rhodothermales bacterium]|jgi:O-acetylhomoserine (thiol)-lyase|nr:PLP-dependent transferase [Rhodothermales bacterium]MDG2017628.1 PLP-dependent transferase [Rhodothermales bacterium]
MSTPDHPAKTSSESEMAYFSAAKLLSPRRKSSSCETISDLAIEQLQHFGIEPQSEYGEAMLDAVEKLYATQADIVRLWDVTTKTIEGLNKEDRIAYFNAKKFLSFQVAKILDTLQNPFRKAYQGLELSDDSMQAKGPYPVFDNVTALFSANPVIVRTATYIYACTEWVDDAFHGKEALHEIYSRLLNPTSISLANHIVDLEAGRHASEYLAWNFNSGMAAIDTLLGHRLGNEDIVIVSRNVYGGTHQLLHDYYGDSRRMNVHLEWFDGYEGADFDELADRVAEKYAESIAEGVQVHVFIESPCNPHGYVLDVPEICSRAHKRGWSVIHDSTVATPFLNKPLQRDDKSERPDYLIHSYTKDLTGNGNATAGVVIGENKNMFIPKGETYQDVSWENTLFWDAYYIKGSFLDADKAFEVISGMKTLDMRMMKKCVNTLILARFLATHPQINVNCNAIDGHWNYKIREKNLRLSLPAPLFTIDFEDAGLDRETFVSFFDSLSPVFNHMVSLGQCNTTILCPAFTSHSELDAVALKDAGISETNIRIAVGDENPKQLIGHFLNAARLVIDPNQPGFTNAFPTSEEVDVMVRDTYLDAHSKYIQATDSLSSFIS